MKPDASISVFEINSLDVSIVCHPNLTNVVSKCVTQFSCGCLVHRAAFRAVGKAEDGWEAASRGSSYASRLQGFMTVKMVHVKCYVFAKQ